MRLVNLLQKIKNLQIPAIQVEFSQIKPPAKMEAAKNPANIELPETLPETSREANNNQADYFETDNESMKKYFERSATQNADPGLNSVVVNYCDEWGKFYTQILKMFSRKILTFCSIFNRSILIIRVVHHI